MTLAGFIVEALASRGQTVAVAESLTGGLLANSFVEIPGASQVFTGGVVVYQADQKVRQLGIDPAVLATKGTVAPEVAVRMAESVREKFHADFGLSTTGVAGPDVIEGKPAGTVFIGIATPRGSQALAFSFAGSRHEVRMSSVAEALSGLVAIREEQS